MADNKRIQELAHRYKNGTISAEEKAEFENWLNENSDQPIEVPEAYASSETEAEARLLASIEKQIDQPIKVRRLWPRIAAAASILIAISAGGYFLLHQHPDAERITKNDIAPFSKLAVLKTGHGKTIVLNNNFKGTLAQYTQTSIQQTGDEQIAYSSNAGTDEQIKYDTLQVPAGGKPYHLKFTDGSIIIVNVASALRFPENFNGNKREAQLISGEAYFSIVHNSRSPFSLKAKGQLIEDIGTEFNVNTYADEPDSRTTLVSGAVRVNKKTLNPGQQAIITPTSIVIAAADLDQTTAWKNGYFRFNGENIQTIMRELSRWYNIDVKYDGKISTEGYYVKVSRSKNISEVLKALERTNSVHFKIEGRRVTVLSKK